jgi:L-glyceraldehyde 3-phosphate reductase
VIEERYVAAADRYEAIGAVYRRAGRSGIRLPALSLGLWQNFGRTTTMERQRGILRRAFDLGITHFDLANNYGPPPGSAEENFGKMLTLDLAPYRDELIVSTKAGYRMHPGPYGEWGSRKYLLSSLDASLKRMGLDYVDIFYSHRPDPHTPLEETMGALAQSVRSGKALYVGVSNYDAPTTARAAQILRDLGVPALIHQPNYNMFNRWIEPELLGVLDREGMGCIPFCPLAQGLLTNRYLGGIPEDARASKSHGFLKADGITPELVAKVQKLNVVARERGQSLARMALAWVLRDARVTTALIGASKVAQVEDCVGALENTRFSREELARIDAILA